MIETRQLGLFYRGFKAVDNVSFCLKKGEVTGLLGHNGAGKTTLMRMLSGELEPSTGSVIFDGKPLLSNRRELAARMGYLPESPPFYPELSVVEFLDYAAGMQGVRGAGKAARIRGVLQKTGLTAVALKKIGRLSRGYQQRVALAQAIVHQPDFIMLDEPSNGLDPVQSGELRQLLQSLSSTSAVLLSTHVLSEVEQSCDRVLVMRAGKLVVDQYLDTLVAGKLINLSCSLSPARLVECCHGDFEVQQHALVADGVYQYRLSLSETSAMTIEQFAAFMASSILATGERLYTLDSQKTTLQSFVQTALVEQHTKQADGKPFDVNASGKPEEC
ncbi:MAG: ABC transporter ATP-binding protein [Pseudomonadales bacterium]|nr:ABC transporter ATP-binding protein [Pseudomonadales bacterium]